MAYDLVDRSTPGVSGPAYDMVAVTPNDDTNLPSGPCKAIYVGVTGHVVIIPPGSSTSVTLKNLLQGHLHRIAARRILATGTTATDIVAAY